MTQTIWTVIAKSEIGTAIYPQDSASTTDKAAAIAWAQTELENGASIMAMGINGDDVRNATHEITESAAELTLTAYAAKGFEADDMPDWVKATDAFDAFEAGETAERGEISDRQSAWNDYRACIEIGVRGL